VPAFVGYSVTTVTVAVVVILIHHHHRQQYAVMYLGTTLHYKPQGHRSIPDGVTKLFQLTFVFSVYSWLFNLNKAGKQFSFPFSCTLYL
jgi:hypothetical protein